MWIYNLLSVFLLLAYECFAKESIQSLQVGSYSQFKCIKDKGFNKLLITVYGYDWTLEMNAVRNIPTAKNADLEVELVYVPCRCNQPEFQVSRWVSQIKKELYSKLWIQPNNIYRVCDWKKATNASNCEFLKKLVNGFKQQNISVGVKTRMNQWFFTFGAEQACSELGYLPLYWDYNDGKPDFSTYVQIGGWKIPSMKQFEYRDVCGQAYISYEP